MTPERQRARWLVRRWRELAEADGHDWRQLVAEDRALPYIEAVQLDLAMREQLATAPEAGGPRDPAIGPHPRFREMDARRERYLSLTPQQQAEYQRLRPHAEALGYSDEQLFAAVTRGAAAAAVCASLLPLLSPWLNAWQGGDS